MIVQHYAPTMRRLSGFGDACSDCQQSAGGNTAACNDCADSGGGQQTSSDTPWWQSLLNLGTGIAGTLLGHGGQSQTAALAAAQAAQTQKTILTVGALGIGGLIVWKVLERRAPARVNGYRRRKHR